MEGNSICIPKKVNMVKRDPIKIEQNNNNYSLNIGVNEDIITFSINDKENILTVHYIKTMSFQEIKGLNRIFLGLSSFNDFYEYLQTLSVNKKINIEKGKEKITVILLAEYLSRPEIIKINLSQGKIDLDLNIKNICQELLSMKEKIKDIDILKSENKELKEKQSKEIDSLTEKLNEKENVINGLKEKVENQNKEMSTLNQKLNEYENVINRLKETVEKHNKEINTLKEKSNENEINELKGKFGNQNKEINALIEKLNEKENKDVVNSLKGTVENQNKEINTLKENKNEVNLLKDKVDNQNKEINSLKENLNEKESKNEVNLLKTKFDNQNKEINTLKENLNEKENKKEVNLLKTKFDNQNKEINTLKENLNEKENKTEVNLLKEKVDNQNKEINTLKENLNEKESKNEVNLLKTKFDNQNKEINTLKDGLNKLNEMNDKSTIMNYDERILIFSEIESKMNKKIKLIKKLYQATNDGGDPINFHSKCDNIENTLVLIKSEGFKKFGGFTPIPWKSNGNYKDDTSSNSFVFSLDKQKIYSLKQGWFSVYHNKNNGPSFGNDIWIEGNPLKENTLFTKKWSYDYKGDNFSLSDNVKKIKALEYEVFQIIFF